MENEQRRKVLFGIVIIAVLFVGYLAFSNGKDSKTNNFINKSELKSQPNAQSNYSQDKSQPSNEKTTIVESQSNSKTADSQQNQVQQGSKTTTENKQDPNTSSAPPINGTSSDDKTVKIVKSEISSIAKFYPYTVDNTKMEIIAVKATDGTIRTALNTCQICWDSGRGYYIQEGDYLVCQNCGNRFHIDQIEKVKGGCNPVPILEKDKTDKGDYIAISNEYLASQINWFANWKTN
ncbi:MAG: DUF2318 domain-containing protein [Acidobacteriota bacterium]